MSVYNEEEHVDDAIQSILAQTYSDFEFLIVDDGSTDATLDIIRSFDDSRIRIEHLEENVGRSNAHNRGLEIARGRYVARLDADDIAEPHRLETQVAFMNTHPEVDICGTAARTFGGKVEETWNASRLDHEQVGARLLIFCSLIHSTLIIRREIMEKYNLYYDEGYEVAEDYDLFVRALPHVRFANLPEVLVRVRFDREARTDSEAQKRRYVEMVRERQLRSLGIKPTARQMQLHSAIHLSPSYTLRSSTDVVELTRWLDLILERNRVQGTYSQEALADILDIFLSKALGTFSRKRKQWALLRSLPSDIVQRRLKRKVLRSGERIASFFK